MESQRLLSDYGRLSDLRPGTQKIGEQMISDAQELVHSGDLIDPAPELASLEGDDLAYDQQVMDLINSPNSLGVMTGDDELDISEDKVFEAARSLRLHRAEILDEYEGGDDARRANIATKLGAIGIAMDIASNPAGTEPYGGEPNYLGVQSGFEATNSQYNASFDGPQRIGGATS